NREIGQRFHADRLRVIVFEEGRAGELGCAVHHHPAAAAHAHAAGPTVRQRAIHLVLQIVERVQHDPILMVRHRIAPTGRFLFYLRPIPEDLQCDGGLSHHYAPYFRSAGGQRVITTSRYSTRGGPSVRDASECARNFSSSRLGYSGRCGEPRDRFGARGEWGTASAISSMKSSSSAVVSSVLNVRLWSSREMRVKRSFSSASLSQVAWSDDSIR